MGGRGLRRGGRRRREGDRRERRERGQALRAGSCGLAQVHGLRCCWIIGRTSGRAAHLTGAHSVQSGCHVHTRRPRLHGPRARTRRAGPDHHHAEPACRRGHRGKGRVVGEGWHRRAGEPHAEMVALAQAGGRGARRHRLRDPGALQPLRPHAALRATRCRGRRGPGGRGDGRPESARQRPGPGAAARRRHRRALRPAAAGGRRAEHRLRVADGARPALGAAEDRGEPGRRHGAAQRPQPVDHRRGRAHRRPRVARAGLRDPHRHRHRARRRSAADRAAGRDHAPAAAGAGRLAARDATLEAQLLAAGGPVLVACATDDPAKERAAARSRLRGADAAECRTARSTCRR